MIAIDGAFGEGGGQVLRSSLALAMVTGQAFRIEKIRAHRKKPGLMRQHLTAVQAAARVCGAMVRGDVIGSRELTFEPGAVSPGEYAFAVGTAGSTTLVLQTVLPALMGATGPSRLTLQGGTHNPWAPPFPFLDKALLPLLRRMGAKVEATLVRPGFYPAGGGEFTVDIEPAKVLRPLELIERGGVVRRRGVAVVSRLPEHIARRELKTLGAKLDWPADWMAVEVVRDAQGPGNVVLAELAYDHVTEVFTGFGAPGVAAESVAAGVAREVRRYLAAGVPVGEHLADQLLVPLALAGGRYRTLSPTRHTTTNIELIGRFIDARIELTRIDATVWEITGIGQKGYQLRSTTPYPLGWMRVRYGCGSTCTACCTRR